MEIRRACRVLKRFRRKNNLRLEITDGLSENSNFSKGPRLILGGRGHSGVAPRARLPVPPKLSFEVRRSRPCNHIIQAPICHATTA